MSTTLTTLNFHTLSRTEGYRTAQHRTERHAKWYVLDRLLLLTTCNINIVFVLASKVNTVIEDDQDAVISTFDVFDTASLEQSTTNMVNDIAMLRKFCEDQIVQKTLERKKRKESAVKRKGHGRHGGPGDFD